MTFASYLVKLSYLIYWNCLLTCLQTSRITPHCILIYYLNTFRFIYLSCDMITELIYLIPFSGFSMSLRQIAGSFTWPTKKPTWCKPPPVLRCSSCSSWFSLPVIHHAVVIMDSFCFVFNDVLPHSLSVYYSPLLSFDPSDYHLPFSSIFKFFWIRLVPQSYAS